MSLLLRRRRGGGDGDPILSEPPSSVRVSRPPAAGHRLMWLLVIFLVLVPAAAAVWTAHALVQEQARSAGLARSLSLSQRDLARARGDLDQANGHLRDLQGRLDDSQAQLAEAQQAAAGLSAQLANWRSPGTDWLLQWNSCAGGTGGPSLYACTIRATAPFVVVQPDTFETEISFTATVPITVYVVHAVRYPLYGSDIQESADQKFGPTTHLERAMVTLAEGCGGYVAVFASDQDGVIFPSVWVRYNPAAHATGACART